MYNDASKEPDFQSFENNYYLLLWYLYDHDGVPTLDWFNFIILLDLLLSIFVILLNYKLHSRSVFLYCDKLVRGSGSFVSRIWPDYPRENVQNVYNNFFCTFTVVGGILNALLLCPECPIKSWNFCPLWRVQTFNFKYIVKW